MKVVLIGPTYPFRGGIAHHTTLLAGRLAEKHDVVVLSFAEQYPRVLFPGRTDLDPSESALVVDAEHVLAPLKPWTWLATASRACAVDPDIVVIQWWVPFWAPSLATVATVIRRSSRARVVFVCHNVLPHEGQGMLARLLARAALGRGDDYIVHSAADARALVGLLGSGAQERRVHRALLPDFGISARYDRSDARSRLGLASSHQVVLFFGFVRPYKGLRHLIEALPRLCSRLPELRLVIAGEFWDSFPSYTRRIDELGVTPHVMIENRYIPNEEVGLYFTAADVVVLPYTSATQSAVVALAHRYGRPVISTDVGGLPEAVSHETTGLIVPPGDPGALADAINRYFTDADLRHRLGQGVRQTADRFSWSETVALIESLATPRRALD